MKDWRLIIDKFLKGWKDKDKIIAALACGSYITGNPSKHSDIDLHLILSDEIDWRERGNKIIDGILIEYFANPARQIESYFKEDYNDNNHMSPTQFLTGEVIFDKNGIIEKIKKVAKNYKNKELNGLKGALLELKKYSLWDNLDNLQDSYDKDSVDFYHIYYNFLQEIYEVYTKYLKYPTSGTSKVCDTLTKGSSRKKYLLENFPDGKFVSLFKKSINLEKKKKMLQNIELLANHVLENMGGFKIDGWKIRSPLDIQ